MNQKNLVVVKGIGFVLWLTIAVVSIFFVFYRAITGEGDFFVPLILLVLMAVNYNISTLVRFKTEEAQAVMSIIEKTEKPRGFTQNPYLN